MRCLAQLGPLAGTSALARASPCGSRCRLVQVVGGRCRLEELTQLLEELLCRGGSRLGTLELQVFLGGGEEWRVSSSIVVWRSSIRC